MTKRRRNIVLIVTALLLLLALLIFIHSYFNEQNILGKIKNEADLDATELSYYSYNYEDIHKKLRPEESAKAKDKYDKFIVGADKDEIIQRKKWEIDKKLDEHKMKELLKSSFELHLHSLDRQIILFEARFQDYTTLKTIKEAKEEKKKIQEIIEDLEGVKKD